MLLFATTVIAQNVKDAAATPKVAMIDTSLFSDKELGIRKLAESQRILFSMFIHDNQIALSLNNKIQKLEKEILRSQTQNKPVEDLKGEIEKLNIQVSQEKDEFDVRVKKKWDEMISPINQKISEKLKDFSKEKGYLIVFDKGFEPPVIILGQADDITSDFIRYCNESFDRNP